MRAAPHVEATRAPVAVVLPSRPFTREEHETWAAILRVHRTRRVYQVVPMFDDGLRTLALDRDDIPELDDVNARLERATGWRGVYVKGLEAAESFFPLLQERRFPIGQFVRDRGDLNYTPAPDVVHDLYGHLPLLANPAYADYCQRFGALACKFRHHAGAFRQLERFFWFTIEFGLVSTPAGRRIFGAGIASSIGECEYALSDRPQVLPFDIDVIRHHEFRVDQLQPTLFLLDSPEQLYRSLGALEAAVARDASS